MSGSGGQTHPPQYSGMQLFTLRVRALALETKMAGGFLLSLEDKGGRDLGEIIWESLPSQLKRYSQFPGGLTGSLSAFTCNLPNDGLSCQADLSQLVSQAGPLD